MITENKHFGLDFAENIILSLTNRHALEGEQLAYATMLVGLIWHPSLSIIEDLEKKYGGKNV